MIHVNKDFSAIPAGLTNETAQQKREAALREKNQHDFSSACYGHDSVRQALETLYHNKCAYCEGQIFDGFRLQVEHYRPKNKLKDDAQHSGYYWLAYEWSNLLLACQKCNGKKSNRFPLDAAGARAAHPHADRGQWRADSSSLRAEQAMLLNPELDDRFEEHFDFRPDGTLVAKTLRAEITEALCGLNRDDLVRARRKLLVNAVDDLLDHLYILFEEHPQGEQTVPAAQYDSALRIAFASLIADLREAGQAHYPYSAFSRCLFANFKAFVCQAIIQREGEELGKKEAEKAAAIVWDAYQRFAATLSF
jgi:uncharacterized protein (TIGR02646 family)